MRETKKKKNQGRREEGKEKMKTEKKKPHITNYAFSTNKRIFQ